MIIKLKKLNPQESLINGIDIPVFKEYLIKSKKAGINKRTIYWKRKVLINLCSYLREKNIEDLKSIDESKIEGFKDYLKKGCSKKSMKNLIKFLKPLFEYLLKKQVILNNPFKDQRIKEINTDRLPQDLKKYYLMYIDIKEKENTSESAIRGIKRSLSILFDYLADNVITKIIDIKKEDLKGLIGSLIELKKEDGSNFYKVSSINLIIQKLRGWFTWLSQKGIRMGLLPALNNLKSVTSISRNILTRKEICSLFQVEVKSLYEFMLKTFIICQYSTGLRINELLGLKNKDIDYENKVLLIYESKTRKERFVHIGDVGLNYLKIYLGSVRKKINADLNNIENMFISNVEGMILKDGVVNKYLRIFCKKALITKNISSHCFRHSYGTHLLENGAEIKHVSELLGHEKLSTTESYTRLSPERLKEVIKKYHPREKEMYKWN